MTISKLAITVLLGTSLAVSSIALAQPPTARMTGTWQFSCTNRRGRTRQISVQVQQSGSTLTGTFSGRRGTGKLSGSVDGDHVSLVLSGRRRSLDLSGTIRSDTVNVRSARGISCSATRQ